MAKDRRSKDQKRKAKLQARAKRDREVEYLTPYEGRKYHAASWVPAVYATERAVYEASELSRHTLTNEQVESAFVLLLEHLHEKGPPLLDDDAPSVPLQPGTEAFFVCWNIRRHWGEFFRTNGPVSSHDLTGILRTLLASLEIHNWRTGAARGYLEFLREFMQEGMAGGASRPWDVAEEPEEEERW